MKSQNIYELVQKVKKKYRTNDPFELAETLGIESSNVLLKN